MNGLPNWQEWIFELVFYKNVIFSAENRRKSAKICKNRRKSAKIATNSDNNIDTLTLMATVALTVMAKPALQSAKLCVVLDTHEWFGIDARPKMARIEIGPELTNSFEEKTKGRFLILPRHPRGVAFFANGP
jgi:hypothetical protein